MNQSIIRTYSELSQLKTFKERFDYLKLDGVVGNPTLGPYRYLCQNFYKNDKEWIALKNEIIIRDNGCDLGVEGYEIETLDRLFAKGSKVKSMIIIHHMNPVTAEDFINRTDWLLDPDFLVCTSFRTHQGIHFGDDSVVMVGPAIRSPNDTCPWKR